MALSFKQSQQNIQEQSIVTPIVMSSDVISLCYSDDLQIAAYSNDEFQISDKYVYYKNYSDENISYISYS